MPTPSTSHPATTYGNRLNGDTLRRRPRGVERDEPGEVQRADEHEPGGRRPGPRRDRRQRHRQPMVAAQREEHPRADRGAAEPGADRADDRDERQQVPIHEPTYISPS